MIFGEEEWPLWTKHDSLLAVAFERYQGFQTSEGHPIFWDQSDRVVAKVKTQKSKAKEALDKWEHQQQKRLDRMRKNNPDAILDPGVIPYVVFEAVDGGALPTLEEWVAQKSSEVPSFGEADSLLNQEQYLADLESSMSPSQIAEKYNIQKSDVIRHRRNPEPFVPDLERARQVRQERAKSRASRTVTQR